MFEGGVAATAACTPMTSCCIASASQADAAQYCALNPARVSACDIERVKPLYLDAEDFVAQLPVLALALLAAVPLHLAPRALHQLFLLLIRLACGAVAQEHARNAMRLRGILKL